MFVYALNPSQPRPHSLLSNGRVGASNGLNNRKATDSFTTQQVTPHQPADTVSFGVSVTPNNNLAEHWKTKGNQAHYARRYGEAALAYKKAVHYQPNYADAWFNLGHTYINLGQTNEAIDAFTRLLALHPKDHEARINLVEQLVAKNLKHQAIGHLGTILRHAPGFDPAKRLNGLYRLQHWAHETGYRYGTQYQAVLQNLGQWNMAQAKHWLIAYLQAHPQLKYAIPPSFPGQKPVTLQRILTNQPALRYVFAPTTQIDNVANLAEYDHHPHDGNPTPVIRFSPEMAFAHPAVLAAYWLHEAIHAEDEDGLTSIAEEQHAYREKTKFWAWARVQQHQPNLTPSNKGLSTQLADPNLDYALHLYQTNPAELDDKVALHYKMRDPNITNHSPGHTRAANSHQ